MHSRRLVGKRYEIINGLIINLSPFHKHLIDYSFTFSFIIQTYIYRISFYNLITCESKWVLSLIDLNVIVCKISM